MIYLQFLFSAHATIGSIRGENVAKSPSSSLASFCHYALTLDIGAVPENSYFVRVTDLCAKRRTSVYDDTALVGRS